MIEIPGIERRAVEFRFRRRHEPKLGHVRLAENHETSRPIPRSQKRIGKAWNRGYEMRALTRGQAFREPADVLEKEGHAGEVTLRQFIARPRPCPFIVAVDDEVELRIELLRPRDRFIHE